MGVMKDLMIQRDECIEIKNVTLLATSSKAVYVHIPDKLPCWFPNSQIHDDSEIHSGADDGTVGSLIITEWLADKRGI